MFSTDDMQEEKLKEVSHCTIISYYYYYYYYYHYKAVGDDDIHCRANKKMFLGSTICMIDRFRKMMVS